MNQAVAPPARTNTMAVVALVFGIAAWLVLPLIGAVVAIVCGHLARGELRRAPVTTEGDGLAVAALMLGYVQLLLVALAFGLIWGVLFLNLGADWRP